LAIVCAGEKQLFGKIAACYTSLCGNAEEKPRHFGRKKASAAGEMKKAFFVIRP